MAQDKLNTAASTETWGENDKPAPASGSTDWGAGDTEFLPEPPARGFKGWARDIAATAVKGAIAVPEALVGLADIPTGGQVGKFLENEGGSVGFRPKEAKELVNDWHSDATKEAQRKFQAADGIVDKTVTAIQNPSLIATAVGESLPSMGLGGVAARGLMTATKLGQMGAKGAALAGAAGEGVTMAGSAAEQIRQETPDGLLTPGQAGLSLATGVVGGAAGVVGNRFANRLGVGDVDTMIAQGSKGMADEAGAAAVRAAANPLVQQQAMKGIPRRVIEGAISEGFLEELPQSLAEQIFQNLALGKDWLQDVDSAAVMGVLSGAAMGGAASGYHGMRQPAPAAGPGQPAPQAPGESPAPSNSGMDRVRQAYADQLAALQEQELGDPGVPQSTPPDGAAVLAQQQAADAARRQAAQDASRAVAEPDDEIYQSTGAAVRPSVRMGLDPAAGPLSAGAALAVDAGVTGQMQQAAALAQDAEQAEKGAKKPATNNQKQEQQTQAQQGVDQETGEIQTDGMAAWSDEQLSHAFRGAQSRDVRVQLAQELSRRRAAREQQELQAELDDEQRGTVPGAERTDTAFAALTEDAGQVPAELSIPTTPQGVPDGRQADQAQQARTQPPQEGAAPTVARAAPDAQGIAGPQDAGAAGVANGSTTPANPGAQAAAASGAQAAPEAEGREQRAQRLDNVGKTWTRMTTVERQALAQRIAANPITKKNLHGAVWANLNANLQLKIADALEPAARADEPTPAVPVETEQNQTETHKDQAPAAINNVAESAKRQKAIQRVADGRGWFLSQDKANAFVADSGLGDTHEVVQDQKRFVVQEKAKAPAEAAKEAPWSNDEEKRLLSVIGRNGGVVTKDMGGHFYTEVAVTNNDTKGVRAQGKTALDAKRALLAKLEAAPAAPAPAAPAQEKPNADGSTIVGRRSDGVMIRQDKNGVRFYAEGGVRISETVELRPTRQGMQMDKGELKPEFMTAEESTVASSKSPTPETTRPELSEAASTETMDLRKLAHADERPGDIMLGNDKFVTLDQAMAAAKAEMEPEAWSKPFQFSRVLDIAPRDWNRMVQAMTGKEYRDPTKGGTTDSERAEKVNTAPKKKPTTDQTRAKADLMNALADLGDILGKNTRMNIVPEQEQKLLPVLTRVLDAAFRLGYHKFKDSAKFALDQIREHLGADAADALTLDHLQGAYIAMAGGKQGADTKRAVIDVESKAEIEAHEAVTADSETDTMESPAEGAAPTGADDERNNLPSQSPQALGKVAAAEGGQPESSGRAGAGAADGGQGSRQDGGRADGAGVPAARSGGSGTGRVRAAQAGARGKSGAVGTQGTGDAGAPAPAADGRVAVPGGASSAPNIPAANFQITDEVALGKGGEVQKFNDNLAAIRALKQIEAENRRATPDEQAALARYVGWGGLANAFPDPISGEFKDKWKARGEELRELLTDAEYKAARRSTRNAHYTSQTIVTGIWNAVRRLGYRGGLVLESSMGSGNFLGLAPADLAHRFVGVEYDSLTARIGQALYPQATVLHSGFQSVPVPDNAFMLNIGNPPFDSESLRFQFKPELQGVSIHNQFFRAGMDALRPGGLQAMVVSRFLMDAKDKSSRLAMASKAKLIAAIRLPDTAFKENARTEVVTDILIFQKLEPGEQAAMEVAVEEYRKLQAKAKDADAQAAALVPAWVETVELNDPLGGDPMTVNAYFQQNPGHVLGVLERSGSMQHGADITVRLDNPAELGERLAAVVATLPENVQNIEQEVMDATAARHRTMSDALRIALAAEEAGHVKTTPDGKLQRVIERETPEGDYEFAYQDIDENSPWSESLSQDAEGRWYELVEARDEQGQKVKVLGKDGKPTKRNLYERKVFADVSEISPRKLLGKTGLQRLKGLVKLRDLLKRQLTLETADAAKVVMEGNRKALAAAYAEFIKANGPVNRSANMALAMTMPDGGLVAALEVDYQPERTAAQAASSGLPEQSEVAKPAPILRERVVPKYEPATKAATASDALAITLSERGRVDMERIAALLGVSEEAAAEQLQDGADPLVFKDPESGAWETADVYLSGMVKRKLNAARAAGQAKNVQALEKVIPDDWTAENVQATMGATWVPTDVYGAFMDYLAGGSTKVGFSSVTNSFTVNTRNPDGSKFRQWSSEGAPADYIVTRILNSKPVTVTAKDGDGNTYVDKERTALAGLKAREIVAEFGDWVFKDGDRRQRLVSLFNEKFNTRVVRQYNGQHLALPGKVPDAIIKMRRHQLNAIWRGIYERFMLVDHAVGAGKTFTAIARAMERRRMGLSRKPMIVVPNHLVEQWEADVYRLYPGAKVLAAGKKDFEAKRRRRLFGKIATGDWDIVIVPHSSFGFIGISQETESRYLELEMAQAQAAIEDAWKQAQEDGADNGRRKPFGVKEAERLAEKIQARMDRLKEGVRDRLLTFEQMGVDDLTVDEAHEFKNLYYSSNLTGVRGMGDKTGSRKANDLYNKVRMLTEQPTATVSFLTGTPISNSAVEMFTMLRYLAAQSLEDMGLTHFDAFRTQFVEATPAFEPTESGRLKQVTRLGRTWSNMRSLMDLYYQVTDAVSLEDIKRFYAEDNQGQSFPVPKVAGDKDRRLIAIKPTPAQEQELKDVMAGFDGLDGIEDPYERNAERLRLMDRARKVSLDVRAVNPRNPSTEEGGKLQRVSQEVKRIYDKWDADKGTQLIFLDRSVPKSKGDDATIKAYDALVAKRDKALADDDQEAYDEAQEALDRYDPNEIAELRMAQASPWNAYQQIKDNLMAMGIPADEIRFVQEAANDEQKAALFDAVNGGKVRVLLGSTPRMGAGTNVQKRAVALHHVDVTWKPSDIEQREGRVVRQGNALLEKHGEGFEVELLAYATERTVDAKMWDLNATKLRTINGIRKYQGAFTMEFDDEEAVGMAEMAALASGNPLLLERVQAESEIQTLEMLERAHRRKMWGVADDLDSARRAIERNPGMIETARQRTEDARTRIGAVDEAAQKRAVTVEGERFSEQSDALRAAEAAIKLQQEGSDKARFAITIDGERVSSKDAVSAAIGAALGDVDTFEATVNGKRVLQRTAAAREIAALANEQHHDKDGAKVVPLGSLYGYELVADIDFATVDGERVKNLRLALMNGEKTIASDDANEAKSNIQYTATNIRAPLERLVDRVRAMATDTDVSYLTRQLERAKRDLPELEARAGETFPKTGELAAKRERLKELVSLLDGKAAAQPTTEQQAEEGDEAQFGAKAPEQTVGTPTDRAIMDMAREGRTAQDMLRLVAGTSKSRFNRQVARLLLKSGIAPAVRLEQTDLGSGDGFTFLAKYSRKHDALTLTPGAQAQAEHIVMHELMHAATLRALDRKGLASLQMRRLYEHVKKQGGAAGHYGMKNVGEFVAEAFTNPEFQRALRGITAPPGGTLKTAWDGFLRILRSILGLPQDAHDALSQALELGVAVMREDKALRQRGVRGRGGDAHAGTVSDDEDIAHFGASDLSLVKSGALDQLHRTLSHPGKVSLWDKTVGTMRHLGERSPAFKPVYQAAQRFIDDVSMLGNDAADRAPRLLPRVETLADLKKKPITPADNKAVGKPLFEGTLLWARDVDGTPVTTEALNAKYRNATPDEKAQILLRTGKIQAQMLKVWRGLPVDQFNAIINNKFDSTILKPGVVWSAKELEELFGLNDQQVSLYQEARKAIDRSIDMTARADMLRMMGDEYASMREVVLEQASMQDAMVLLTDALQADARENPDQADRLMGLNNSVVKSYERAVSLQGAGYAPLSRFGRYTVDVVGQDGTREYFGMFETMRDANLMAERMRGEFKGAAVTQGTMSDEAYKLFAGITPESLEQFGGMLGLKSDGATAQDKAFQAYLQLAKNNHSALKRLIHRKGISGYSEDVGRVLASFVYSNARLAAGGLNAGTLEAAIEAIPKEQGELRDVAMGLRSYIQDPQEEGQAVRGMLFAQYLGGSVASALVNMTQPFQITMPWLSQFGGMRKAGAHLGAALRDMARGGKYEPDLAQALHAAQEDGVVSPQEIHQLMAQARGTGSLRVGDGTRLGDARAAAANNWERAKVAWGQPFALAEQFNRRSTFIAAYRLAKEQGMAAPAEFARRAVLETQFVYSKANKPKWARGAIGGTLFTFKTYSVSYLELMQRMWTQGGPEGKRAVGWAVAMLLLMSGAGGLPFMEDAEDLIDGAGQLMGYNVSAKQWRKQMLRDTLGKELADFVDQGVSGLPGAPIDVSGRLGMGNLLPGTGLLLSKQSRERDLLEVAGPAGDLVARGFKGARKALTGDLAGAALEVSPAAVRNAAKGIDMATSGIYKDTKGYKVMDTTLDEAIFKTLGFQPHSVAEDSQATAYKQRMKTFYTQTSGEIKAQWADALFRKDEGDLQRVRERLADWNRDNPDQPIVVKMPDIWKKVREMGKDRSQRIADTAPKALRGQMREMARENG